jgi:hypothetical protein
MSDNLKMFGRYGLAVAVSFAVGKGWITPEQSETVTNIVIQLAGIAIAFAPAAWAAAFVDNKPKP